MIAKYLTADILFVNKSIGGKSFVVEGPLDGIVNMIKPNNYLLQKTGQLGRWGGEEFMIILNDTDINMAKNLAERIRKTIAAIDFEEIGSITASFGVVSVEQNDNEIQVYKRVDAALYEAKKSGRNKVVTA